MHENQFFSWSEQLQGILQGSVVGPLLINIYLFNLLEIACVIVQMILLHMHAIEIEYHVIC